MTPFVHQTVVVKENVCLARDTWRIRLTAPALAHAIRPGQFVMLRLLDCSDPLLGRPFALYDTVVDNAGEAVAVDIVYLVVGKLTGQLAQITTGDNLDVWGPLGNGFPDLRGAAHVALVAGGIGQTPFLAHIRALLGTRGYGNATPTAQTPHVSVYYGVRSAELLAGVEDFRDAGATVYLSTDDGSHGYHGLVTDLLDEHLRDWKTTTIPAPSHLVGCGPEPMMLALRDLAERRVLPCYLSLETPMACGVGICFSCVTPVQTADGWDYQRVCVDGPVFNAAKLWFGEC